MTINIVLKNGATIAVKCEEFKLSRNRLGQVAGWEIKKITENNPIHIDFSEIVAIVRVMSDEQTAGTDGC